LSVGRTNIVARYKEWSTDVTNYKKWRVLICILVSEKDYSEENASIVKGLFEYEVCRLLTESTFKMCFYRNIEKAIKECSKRDDFDFLIISKLGHDYRDFFYLLTEYLNENIGLMGHILDRKERYYELHDQHIVINRALLAKLNEVPFYKNENANKELIYIERSEENFHDDYTPISVCAGEGQIRVKDIANGGLWIHEALSAGLDIVPFNEELRREKRFFYPNEKLITCEALRIEETGRYDPFFPISLEKAIITREFIGPLENLIAVCSSLRPFLLLKEYGYSHETKIYLIDFSKISLEIMRFLFIEWDGKDYPELMESLKPIIRRNSKENLDEYWNYFLSFWESEDKWLLFLKDIREKCVVVLKEINLCDADSLDFYFNKESDGKRDYLWLSNSFNYKPTMTMLDSDVIRGSAMNFFTKAKKSKPELFYDGFMPNNLRLAGDFIRNIHLFKDLTLENAVDYGEAFCFFQENVFGYKDKNSENTPFPLVDTAFPHEEILSEAISLERSYFKHRLDADGWTSVALHGISNSHTQSHSHYGYQTEDEVPYQWTSAVEKTPVLNKWLEDFLSEGDIFEKYYRVRIMRLAPGGYILPHQDHKSGERKFFAINIAINNPDLAKIVFKGFGVTPWVAGDVRLYDVSVPHSACNPSDSPRYHLIIHGKFKRTQSELLKLVKRNQ
jgi:hypothetical protein